VVRAEFIIRVLGVQGPAVRALAAFGALVSCAAPPSAQAVTPLEVPKLGGAAAGASGESGIRFGRIPPTVGSRWAVTVEGRSVLMVTDAHGTEPQISEYASAYTVEILAVDGPAPSRVRVVFEKNVQRYMHAEKPTAIHGKTYIVDEALPHVQSPSGAPVPEEEAQRVLDVFPELGTRTQIDQVLPDDAMTVGEERHEIAGAIVRVIHPRAWTLGAGRAVLVRADGGDGVFVVTLDATSQNGLRIEVAGEARIRLHDARLVSIQLDGTFVGPDSSEPGLFTLRRSVRDL
jgi:hypothetical protein